MAGIQFVRDSLLLKNKNLLPMSELLQGACTKQEGPMIHRYLIIIIIIKFMYLATKREKSFPN